MGLISLLFATPFVHTFGVRSSLIIGSVCFFVWIILIIIPLVLPANTDFLLTFVYSTSLIGGVILGFGSSIIWVANGKQLKDVGTDGSGSFYLGLFWSIFSISGVVSNIIGSVMIDKGGVMAIFIVASGVAVLSTLIMSCKIVKISKSGRKIEGENKFESHEEIFDFRTYSDCLSDLDFDENCQNGTF